MENLYFIGMLLVGMLIGALFGMGGLFVAYYFYKNMNGNNKSKLFASFDQIAESEENNNE